MEELNFYLRVSTKKELCILLKDRYGFKLYPRNIKIVGYTEGGYIQSFVVKLSSNNYLFFVYNDAELKYVINEKLTCEYNENMLSLKKNNIVTTMKFQCENPLDKGRFNEILSKEFNRR